jgi:chromosome segregation ATPase
MSNTSKEHIVTEENKDQVTDTPEVAPEEITAEDPRIAELEAQLASRDAEFGKIKEDLNKQVETVLSQEKELTDLRTAASAAEERIAELSGSLTEAVSRYKERLYSAHPELLENMLTGETIKEVDGSLESALALVDRVKTHVAEKAKEVTVPAGSPERTGPDLSAMSAKEKIAYAIGKEAT